MSYAIQARDLSKRYRLGVAGSNWLAKDVHRWLGRVFAGSEGARKGDTTGSDYIWALKDVTFEVAPGEVMGIVGRNGAGKSTLLKVLSRITRPTRGEARVRGRIASLLEVGTGFHPELTGRENVYLNGAILGMNTAEVRSRFDEIIAFSGVENFVDTPVKRYSSGMYLRLAFAVAAHLQTEILLVDEVLAVGDFEFQRKCLQKMEDVGQQGRTVLFVSHNMGSLLSLCQSGISIDSGEIVARGTIKEVVDDYLTGRWPVTPGFARRVPFDPSRQVVESVELMDSEMRRRSTFDYGSMMHILLHSPGIKRERFGLELRIRSSKQELIAYASSWINQQDGVFEQPGKILITIPALKLVQDDYVLDFNLRIPHLYHVDAWWEAVQFTIANCRPPGSPISLARLEHWGSVVLDDVTMKAVGATGTTTSK